MYLNLGEIATKTIGLAAGGYITYNAINNGKQNAIEKSKQAAVDDLPDQFIYASNINDSNPLSDNKKKWKINQEFTGNFKIFKSGVTGFCSGFLESLYNDLLPLGLSLGTIFLSKNKNPLGKICLIALAFNYLLSSFSDFINKKNSELF